VNITIHSVLNKVVHKNKYVLRSLGNISVTYLIGREARIKFSSLQLLISNNNDLP